MSTLEAECPRCHATLEIQVHENGEQRLSVENVRVSKPFMPSDYR